jgi:nitrate reductase alpha subunit
MLDKHELQVVNEFLMVKSHSSAKDEKRELTTCKEAVEASDRGKAVYVWHQFITLKCVGDIAQELAALEAKSEVLRSARHTHSHSTLTSTSRAHLHSHSQLQLKSSKASRKGKKRKDVPASREMPSRALKQRKFVPRASSQPIVSSDDEEVVVLIEESEEEEGFIASGSEGGTEEYESDEEYN